MKKVVSKSGVAFGWVGGVEDGGRGAQKFASAFIGAWSHGKL
jgi:hypothetical protein